MRSGQLARQTGVSTDTLRHYERLRLLPREYPPASQQRVELIRRALTIGFAFAELKTILAVRDKGGAPCRRVYGLLRSKIHDLDRQIKNLVSLRAEMNRLSKEWDKRLRRTTPRQVAKLLESVPPNANTGVANASPIIRKKRGLSLNSEIE